MLKGTLHYTDEKFNITLFVYAKEVGSLQMYLKDNGGSLYDQTQAMYLFDSTYDGEKYVDAAFLGDTSRRLNIKESNGFQTNLQNMLFASRVASAIRYMYEYNERVGKTDEDSGAEKVYSSIQEFRVINCNTGEQLGTFKKDRGILVDVQLNMPYVQLSLSDFDERSLDAQYLTPLKQKDKFGNVLSATKIRNMTFKHDESLLGFKYISKASTAMDVQTSILGMYENMEDVIAAHPEKSFTWIRGRKYEIVTQENVEAIMAEFEAFDGIIAVDTETSGLNITFKSRIGDGDQLTGICMSKEEGTGYYFPLQMRRIPNLFNGDHYYFMQKYKKFFETKKFVTHNLAFDWKVFYIYDINLNAIFDTMLAYAVTERYKQSSFKYGLKELIHNIFGWDMIELSDFIPGAKWGKTSVRFWDLPYELCRQYAPTDADMTLTLYNHVKKIRLLDSFKANKVFEIELKFAKCVAYSEFYGLHIDVDRLPQLIEEVETGKANCEKKLYEIAGETFNPNSPKQLQAIMYDKLGLPDVSNKRSTDKEALKELSSFEDSDGKPLYPFAATLKKYRDEEGIYKSFIKKRDEFMSEDGYIHARVEAFGADTGRVSVNHPNYQSYNDVVKKFVAPRKGFKMWDSDFSQIEYRVLCSMAHEPKLIDSFADPDMDYHTYQAARMFSVPYGAVTKEMRQQCKGINFGLPYGMGDESLGARIFGKRCKENTIKAADLRERYFVGQDNIRKFFDTVRDEGVRDGFTRTLFGRARYYHKSVYPEGAIRRQAGNHVIQGTAADLFKIACIRVFEMLVANGWLGKVLMDAFIHDEILGEVSEDINFYDFVREWRKAFEVPVEGFCKLYAGLGIGNSWYEAKKADWSPQFIQMIIDSPLRESWDNDGDKFIAWSKIAFDEYETQRVYDYLIENSKVKDTLTQEEKIIKPIIESYLKAKVDSHVIADNMENSAKLESIALASNIPLTVITQYGTEQKLAKDKAKFKEYKAAGNVPVSFDLQDRLKLFCAWKGLNYSDIDIVSADSVAIAVEPSKVNTIIEAMDVQVDDMSTDDFILYSVKSFGYMLDIDTSRLILNFDMLGRTKTADKFLELFGKDAGNYRIYGMTFKEDGSFTLFETPKYVKSLDVLSMQMFLQSVANSYNKVV